MQTSSIPPAVADAPFAEQQKSPPRHLILASGYVLVLLLVYSVGMAGIAGLPLQFVLKDQLKLSPTQLSIFGAISGAPTYIGFAFGFLRDRWRPFGKGDRAYFLVLPLLIAAAYLWLSLGSFTYARILGVSMVQSVFGLILGAAANGLTTTIAQRNGMTGRLSVAMLVVPNVVGMASSAIGGHFSHTSAQQHRSLVISAILCLPLIVMAFFEPRALFAAERLPKDEGSESSVTVPAEGTIASLKRLARTQAIYLPAAAVFLFEFAPGWGTPLFYYLTNKVKLSEASFGNAMALMSFGVLGATLSYMFLCSKVRLKINLYTGTFLAVIGCPLFLLIHNTAQANVISIIAGASCGIAVCAYKDLLIRCCPKGLEGAALLFTATAGSIAGAVSDIFGSWLYEKGGFGLALAVTTVTTALIFGVLPLIPSPLLAPREGEPIVPPTFHPLLEEGRAELA